MSGRQSHAVALALKLVIEHGHTVTAAAARQKVALSSVRRALRSSGIGPLSAGRPKK
jgi:hypothetical protein